MNSYQILFGSMWPARAPKHEQFPGRNPQKEEPKAELIDLIPTVGSRKPSAWYRKDFQENCVRNLALFRDTPGLTLRGISGLVGRQEYHVMPAMQALNRCGYIAHEAPLTHIRAPHNGYCKTHSGAKLRIFS